jgi:hypothetical protein
LHATDREDIKHGDYLMPWGIHPIYLTDKQIVVFAEVFGVTVGDLFPPKQKSSGYIIGLNS